MEACHKPTVLVARTDAVGTGRMMPCAGCRQDPFEKYLSNWLLKAMNRHGPSVSEL